MKKNIFDNIFFFKLFLKELSKKPETKNPKQSTKLPTTNSSLKKLTTLFEDELSKPNKLKPKIRSKIISIKTTKIIMDQYKNIWLKIFFELKKKYWTANKKIINLTPTQNGYMCIPVLNLEECNKSIELNMVSCGAQSSVPVAYSLTKVFKNKIH